MYLLFQDPEEFLNGLVAQLLRAEPFLKLSSGQEAYCYQLFVEKDEHVSLPTVQQLLEQSFTTSGVKLSEVGFKKAALRAIIKISQNYMNISTKNSALSL